MTLSMTLAAYPTAWLTAKPVSQPPPDDYRVRSLAADHYAQAMGYFCKKEWKFERATGIPLRIRLGSLEQCNRLEGKD
jgi:hypothetical protein